MILNKHTNHCLTDYITSNYDNYNIKLLSNINDKYDGVILAVSHKKFINLDLKSIKKENKSVVFDLKSFYDRELVDYRL